MIGYTVNVHVFVSATDFIAMPSTGQLYMRTIERQLNLFLELLGDFHTSACYRLQLTRQKDHVKTVERNNLLL